MILGTRPTLRTLGYILLALSVAPLLIAPGLAISEELVDADGGPPEVSSEAAASTVLAAPQYETKVHAVTPGQELKQSAAAVTVVETQQAKQQAADLGEVLARTQGVAVQRAGGLGSDLRFSMNGLTDEEIRFFFDGLPLQLVGYPFGIADVPVNLVDRVDIYLGVVPIRFGSDALGGAVNLISEPLQPGFHGAASAEVGSFDTVRLTATAQELLPDGFFVRGGGFFDYSANNYPVQVQVSNDLGQLTPATVDLNHAQYRAEGASLEVGVIDQPWAHKLAVRLFGTGYSHNIPTNVVMTVPYGAVSASEVNAGGVLTYEEPLSRVWNIDLALGYSYDQTHFLDASTCVYDWYGNCVAMHHQGGEVDGTPHDQIQWQRALFGRFNAAWQVAPQQALRFSVAPTLATSQGEERLLPEPDSIDPLSAQKELTTVIVGSEYEVHLFDDRIENIAFVKGYLQTLQATIPVFRDVTASHDHQIIRGGFGDALRYRLQSWIWFKASYELATRLPTPDEVFGDGILLLPNLDLGPERSNNANVSVTIDARRTSVGSFRLDANGFLRDASNLIVLLGDDQYLRYENVYSGRSIGIESAAGWTSPHDYLALDGNVTWQDFRNTSSQGEFAAYDGDHIPNQPWLFANASARLQYRGLVSDLDETALTFIVRYVHSFYRGWESAGILAYKQVIPTQVLCSLGLTYRVPIDATRLTFTAEIQNLFNEPAYDFFGLQKPGRVFYFKVTASF